MSQHAIIPIISWHLQQTAGSTKEHGKAQLLAWKSYSVSFCRIDEWRPHSTKGFTQGLPCLEELKQSGLLVPTVSNDWFTHGFQGHLHVSRAVGRQKGTGANKSIRCMEQTRAADRPGLESQLCYSAELGTPRSPRFLMAEVGVTPSSWLWGVKKLWSS